MGGLFLFPPQSGGNKRNNERHHRGDGGDHDGDSGDHNGGDHHDDDGGGNDEEAGGVFGRLERVFRIIWLGICFFIVALVAYMEFTFLKALIVAFLKSRN